MDWLAEPPRLHGKLLALGGRAKQAPEDFEVEEIPAYEPAGSGDHLFLWLEKSGLPAHALLEGVGRSLGVAARDIGCAGLKDAQATTRQYLSVPASAEANLARLAELPRVRLLGHRRHGNKLRTGHLRGNRFVMRLRGCHPEAAARAPALVEALRRDGMPNYFGTQRFGRGGATLARGLACLRPETAAQARSPQRSLHRLALSSVQSALFNRYIAQRVEDRSLHSALEGEVMLVCASGGPFTSDDVAALQARLAAHEIVGGGPMFGPKMRRATAAALQREEALLQAADLSLAQFAAHARLLRGTRRANLVFLDDLQIAVGADGDAEVRTSLPAGTYATVLLAELGIGLAAA